MILSLARIQSIRKEDETKKKDSRETIRHALIIIEIQSEATPHSTTDTAGVAVVHSNVPVSENHSGGNQLPIQSGPLLDSRLPTQLLYVGQKSICGNDNSGSKLINNC